MFGRSMFREMEEDPFFASHRQMVDSMFQDPFGMFKTPMLGPGPGAGAMQQPHARGQINRPHPAANMMQPFHGNAMGMMGGFDSMFANMRSMMQNMDRTFEDQRNNPNAHCYSQSSFMSYSNTGQGEPKMYQATSATRTAPGGIKEVRKSLRDSESGLEKMSVGHHIHDRAHIVEKSKNRRTGDVNESEDLINLDDSEKSQFNDEWRKKTRSDRSQLDYARRGERSYDRHRNEPLAIEETRLRHEEPRPKKRHDRYRDRE